MARLTQEEHDGYMHTIMDMYENPDDGAEMISRLREDFVESMEVVEGVPQSDYDALNDKYNSLREKYIARFFGGNDDLDGAKENQSKDIEEDNKGELTFEGVAESYTGKDE